MFFDLYNDGYTELGRKQLGIDHTKDQKYLDALGAITQAQKQLQSVLSQKDKEVWTISVEVR